VKQVGHIEQMGEMRNACKILICKCEDDHLGGLKHRWEDNIEVVHKGVGCEDVDGIYLAQDRVQ
jgi:hypothetical protein